MSEKYIRIRDAVDALAKTMPTPATPDGAGEFDHEIHIADEAFADAIRIIESIEPADVAPVVRCRKCKYFWTYQYMDSMPIETCELAQTFYNPDLDFCSLAKRREE